MTSPLQIGRFRRGQHTVIGVQRGDHVAIVSETDNLAHILAHLPGSVATELATVPLAELAWLPPLDPHARVFAVAVNYAAHGAEANANPPSRPLLFYKPTSAFVGHGDALDPNPGVTQKFDYEGEIAVVIGRRCKQVSRADAMKYVVGICALNDGSARDMTVVQAGDKSWIDWTAAKALERASALGPTILVDDDLKAQVADGSLTFETRLNGNVVQDGRMTEMIFDVPDIIAVLSAYMPLEPGDVIATGTPSGIGMARNRFLTSGDILEIQIHGQDALRVTVA